MRTLLADRLYKAMLKHRNLQQFMNEVADNSLFKTVTKDAKTYKVEYRLMDYTSVTFEDKKVRVWVEMPTGRKMSGIRRLFFDGKHLDDFTIPAVEDDGCWGSFCDASELDYV